jgi:hypothetical protein
MKRERDIREVDYHRQGIGFDHDLPGICRISQKRFVFYGKD